MSISAISKVWKTSHQTGTNLLVLLAIADYAEDDGTNAYPSYGKLGKKARLSRRGAIKAIARLKEAGEIIVHVEAGARTRNNRHTNSFDIVFQDSSNWNVVLKRCQVLGTLLPSKPKGPYIWGDSERQDTNKKSDGEPEDTINSERQDTNNGELGDTQNPSIESSNETLMVEPSDQLFSELVLLLKMPKEVMTPAMQRAYENFIMDIQEIKDSPAKPGDINRFGSWWYETDWRGKDGQKPTLSQVREKWGEFIDPESETNGQKVVASY